MFSRRARTPAAAIAAFWEWWAHVGDDLAAAIEAGQVEKAGRELARRVSAIHSDIVFELGEGMSARHALVLSPEGSPSLRSITERWLRAGPGSDATWEFFPARQPNLRAFEGQLTLGKRIFEPGKARFGAEVDADRARVHVLVQHPDFPFLDDADRLRASFLLLDWALGEDDVERWLGEIRVTGEEQPFDVAGVRDAVAELSARYGHDEWALLEGMDDRGTLVEVRVRVPFPRMDHPLFDLHGSVGLSYRPDTDGLPDVEETGALEAVTSGLLTRLGGSAVLAAIVTKAGIRTLHLYADHQGVVPAQVTAWSGQQARARTAEWLPDPGWEILRTFY
ncbi:MAG: hypothetical protein JWO79_4197 [Actinomycetia bacterium]|jgi:hypothetical protein|nr:hypothetical protein [Actinomycetes bacterium]